MVKRVVLLAVVTAALLGTSVGAKSPGVLTVRLYNSAGAPVHDLLAARRVAEPILRDAGLRVEFRQCGSLRLPGQPVDPCSEPLGSFEVVVRVIDAPHFDLTIGPDVFGVAYVVHRTNRGWLATLYADRIAQAATRVGMDHGTLFGRVMAHEVGHLLLGTREHADTGLMRAEWSDDLLHERDAAWQFSTLERVTMQRAMGVDSPLLPSTR